MQQYPDHLPNYKAITINNPLVHLLVPKKRILTINDLNAADAEIISRLFLATKALAA
ncbi:MAG: hypothetical protein AAF149_12470 [Bacteroidota bacterium]